MSENQKETKEQREARLMVLVEKGHSIPKEDSDWLWEHSLDYHEFGQYGIGPELKYDTEEANKEAEEDWKRRAERMKENGKKSTQ